MIFNMSSSTEELDLLERVFLRVGSAESDEHLESVINKFLIPVLLKLSSPNEGVRKKVMELLVHINKRVRRQQTVQLPVEALLTQYRDPKASSFLINFSILYIKLGFPRLPAEKQQELAPFLLLAIEGKPKIHQDSLLQLLTDSIGNIKVPNDADERRKLFKMDEKPELMKYFSNFMLDILLLPYVHINSSDNDSQSGTIQAPPGMSEYGFKRVTSGEISMTPERLEQTKLGVVKFLATGILSNNDIICHLIIAAADTRFTVANLADAELKKVAGSVDWSSVAVASRLFYIYLGSPEVPAEKRNLIPPANRVTPANTRIRLKILPYLSRLEKEAILFPGSLQVIFNSLYDANTNAKLKLQALNFALAIVRKSDQNALKKMSGMLYTGLLKLVANKEESEQLRVVGYTIIGQIVKRIPNIINKNPVHLHQFFESLTCESTEIRGAVRDSMLTMIDAFKQFMKEEKSDSKSNGEFFILTLLGTQVESKEPMARFVAVKYAAAAFEPDHVPSRYLLLLSCGDSNSDVSSVAQQSLYSKVENDNSQVKKMILPDFREVCQFVHEKSMERMKNVNQRVTIQNRELPFNDVTFTEVLIYLRLCLMNSAGIEVKNKELLQHPCDSSPLIGRYLAEVHRSDESVIEKYLSLIEMYLSALSSLIPLNCLVEIVGTCPGHFAPRYAQKIQWVMNFLNNVKEDIREGGSLLFSNVSVYTLNEDDLSGIIRDLMEKLKTKSLESQHGAILSLGHIIERKIFKSLEDGEKSHDIIKSWEFLGFMITELAKNLDNSQVLLVSSSCTALGQVAKLLPLPLPDDSKEDLSKKKLMKTLLEVVNNPKNSGKLKEKAIRTCGLLCLGEKFPFMRDLAEELLSSAKQTKDVDLHFSLSDALILCLEGISSPEKCDAWKNMKSEFVRPPMPEENLNLLNWLMDELVTLTPQPHPNIRQAVCVIFLSVLKRLSYLPAVKDKLSSIQYVFMELLSENNELVQDMSSKGLAMVYENSTEENKKKLVAGLLDQLLSGKRAVQQVTGGTKLFEEGQLGVSPDGGNLSTYKELCSLASDLNQPDLIYKFMHLANNNAIWNSKKGAAFGFQTIVSQANDQLNEYLPKIVPRLYRYQFDPTPKIQQSMANIWHSVVKDTQKTIDKYFNEILDDLLHNLTSNQWRVRISCCHALSDFFRGNRSLLDARPKLAELWKSLFRVMDDVHEGTRIAALSTGRTLANLCVRICDKEAGKINQEMLDISLSTFLSNVTNPVAEVKNLCLQTVSQLVGSAGSSLKPNLPTLIPSLLEAAGELESVKLSYLSAQYGGQAQSQEMIDVVRANIAKSHYTTQTLTKCIQHVDVEMLDKLVPKITEIMKSVSFGSRIACGHIVILLAHHLGKSMEQYTGKLLSGLVNGLLDRNATVRKSYASAIGQIVHTARDSTVEKLFKKLSTWYFEKEDANTRTAIGCALQAVAHYNGELLKEHFPIVIPLIFFAMHGKKVEGEDNSNVIMWEDIWNDVTPGSEAGIKQHMSEISAVLESALNSPSWTMKAQGGRCMSTIANKIGDTLDEKHVDKLIEMSLSALQGKTFPGKEDILKGLSKLASRSSDSLKRHPEKCQVIVEAILRECGKSEPRYKRFGVEALGEVLEVLDTVDYFQRVYEIIQNFLKQLDEKMDDGETSEELAKIRNEKFKTIEVIYETLGKSWPKKKETQLKYQETLLNECYRALESSPRDVQVAVLSAFRSYIDKLHYFNNIYVVSAEEKDLLPRILEKTTQALHYSLGIQKHTRLRKEALNIIYSLGNKLSDTGRSNEMKILMDSLRSRLEELENDSSPEVRTRLMDLKKMYKN